MLLRSSSTPVLQSLLPDKAAECFLQITPKSRSCSMASFDHDRIKKISRNLSESDLIIRGTPTSTCKHARLLVPVEDAEEDDAEMGCKVGRDAEVVVGGSGGDWSGGGSGGWGGGYGDGDDDDGGGYGWCGDANTSMDLYYEKMIQTNPSNSLLLSNYAIYLKEFRGDLVKAEEYCGRAILVNPNDGNVLSQYGDLIWHMYEDAKRAHIYFDRALKAAPHNSYVMASYARFLWDAEDELEDH